MQAEPVGKTKMNSSNENLAVSALFAAFAFAAAHAVYVAAAATEYAASTAAEIAEAAYRAEAVAAGMYPRRHGDDIRRIRATAAAALSAWRGARDDRDDARRVLDAVEHARASVSA